MKAALFFGHFSSNIGDLAINRGLAHLLKKCFGDSLDLTVFFLNENGRRLGGVDSFGDIFRLHFETIETNPSTALNSLAKPENLWAAGDLSQFDLVLINGGEHFFSYQDNPNLFNLFWRSLPLKAAAKAGVKSIVLPSTFGPFESEASAFFVNHCLSDAYAMLSRDSHSTDQLKKDLPDLTVDTFLDLAFHIEHSPKISTKKSERSIGIITRVDSSGLRAGVEKSRKADSQIENGRHDESLAFTTTYEAAKELILSGFSIRFFIQTESDRILTMALHDRICTEFGDSVSIVHEPKTIEEYLEWLHECTCVLTSRLHAAILSLVASTPVVAFYYSEHGHKMPGVFSLLNASHLCIEINQSKIQEFVQTVSKSVDNAINILPQTLSIIAQKKAVDCNNFSSLALTSDIHKHNQSAPLDISPDWLPDLLFESEKKSLAAVRRQFGIQSKQAKAKIQNLQSELQDLQSKVESYYAKSKSLEFDSATLNIINSTDSDRMDLLVEKCNALNIQTTHLQKKVELLENQLKVILHSKSWLLTKPMRFVGRLLRKYL